MVRTPGFHPGNRGSIPRRNTIKNKRIWQIINLRLKELDNLVREDYQIDTFKLLEMQLQN